MNQSSKELVRGLFQLKDIPRVPFIPWVCSFAAQLEQVPVKAMLSEAGALSRGLINAQKLFGYDAIVNIFDPSLEAEACGCKVDWSEDGALPRVVSHPLGDGAAIEDLDISNIENQGRLPVVIETTKRLNIIKGKDLAIIGLITGPLTLAGHLRGGNLITELNQDSEEAMKVVTLAGSIGLKLCRLYCELGVDVIVIAEEMVGQLHPGRVQAALAPLRSIWNVAGFYNVHTLILSSGCTGDHLEPVLGLQADGLALSGEIGDNQLRDASVKHNKCYSGSITESALCGSSSETGEFTRGLLSRRGKGFFLSTEWEVPFGTSVKNMHEVMGVIRGSQQT